ncbi:MAG: hypothetical protein WC934_13865 [Acidithiobacillus sp.]|jgi:hypothetical protein|uniref:hypothetical protein n=1 Tax=Acidithiobacillus sp. TaxID=1872118 RepID=UPI003560EFAB
MNKKEVNNETCDTKSDIIIPLNNDEIVMLKSVQTNYINTLTNIGELVINILDQYFKAESVQKISDENIKMIGQRYFKEIKNKPWHIDLEKGSIIVTDTLN